MSTISNVFCHDVTIFNYLKIFCQKDFAGHVEYKYITSPRDIKRLLLKKAQCCRQYCHYNAQRTNDNIWLKIVHNQIQCRIARYMVIMKLET